MSADKRTVTTDALETLGTIITDKEKRDAIHLAVEPMVASETLRAGDHVRVLNGVAYFTEADGGIGIVDPFLKEEVKKGERFWLVIYPRKITSLRHVWEHPELPAPTEANSKNDKITASEIWLRSFCQTHDMPPYEIVMRAVSNDLQPPEGYESYPGVIKENEYWTFVGHDAHCTIPPEFWEHVEVVLGRKLNASEKTEYFSCTC